METSTLGSAQATNGNQPEMHQRFEKDDHSEVKSRIIKISLSPYKMTL
jgi:hypothetical protein